MGQRFDPYIYGGGAINGHYAAAQRSGELAATIGALGHLASIRCTTASPLYMVLKRIRVGITVSAAITTATEFTLRAIIARSFSVDFTTASTQVAGSRLKAVMPAAQCPGPRIGTTTVMSGQTLTADAAPFAMATFGSIQLEATTTTAVAIPAGVGLPMVTLYECTADGQYPVVLSQNEGVLIQPVVAGPASGTFALYTQWEWAEVQFG